MSRTFDENALGNMALPLGVRQSLCHIGMALFDEDATMKVLFSGPSGTGKSMALEILEGETGRDLYRIDLSKIISKYIGETERNLAQILARQSRVVLENVTPLLGKPEVRQSLGMDIDTRELESCHQQLLAFDGVMFILTHFRHDLEPALVGSMDRDIIFPIPSEEDRTRIWRQVLSEDDRIAEEVDLHMLAHKLEISGGHIRNIAENARALAGSDQDQATLTLDHMRRAVMVELHRMGRMIDKNMF